MRSKEEIKGLEDIEPDSIHIYDAVIEITRKCNMRCSHCLRGDAENCNINMRYVNTFFSKIDSISNLTLTGGEPSLVPHIINKIIDAANRHNVEISSFYIATNGKKTTRAFVNALLNLWENFNSEFDPNYCDYEDFDFENCMSSVQVSNDLYHKDGEEREGYSLLRALRFVSARNKKDDAEYNLIDQGRASFYHVCKKTLNPDDFTLERTTGDTTISEGTIYLNCKGWIISGCDWSYESQDDEEHDCRICRVKDFSIDKLLEWEGGNVAVL